MKSLGKRRNNHFQALAWSFEIDLESCFAVPECGCFPLAIHVSMYEQCVRIGLVRVCTECLSGHSLIVCPVFLNRHV